MRYLGINCLNHDGAMAVVDNNKILWAAHSERYSKRKNDQFLNWEIVNEALSYGPFDTVIYYERPWLKKLRQLRAGQFRYAFDYKELPSVYLKQFNIKIDEYVEHHKSHAAAGYYTAPFKDSMVLTIDAIGEWETMTISDNMNKKRFWKYPYSLGLFYSAATDKIGLKANEEEYITMGMAAYGHPGGIYDVDYLLERNNHKGFGNNLDGYKKEDIALAIQNCYTRKFIELVDECFSQKENLVISGGCALNCVANTVAAKKYPKNNIWIIPNPSDSGSALGCIAAVSQQHLDWEGPFLGHNIEGEYPIDSLISELRNSQIVGVANGRAEYGPRALGNRSLLADPRGDEIKDLVNQIKKREMFRPFAPAILEEDAKEFFEMSVEKSPYMQFVAKCKYPKDFPAIVHIDGTSRVQTVSEKDNPGFYNLLKTWKDKTGCPMLLNTSLNIKGQPIVNDRKDALSFEAKYGVVVY
jgi:carbamoyltransferase